MKLSNITFKNAFYFAQGYWRKWNYQFLKMISQRMGYYERQVNRKKEACPECFQAGQCTECGCSFMEMAYSEKPCPKNKF